MKALFSAIQITRPGNVVMAAAAAALGFWLSGSTSGPLHLAQIILAAASAVGFGNIINDIVDVESDRISHPDRPLPKNELSLEFAVVLAFFFCSFSFVNGFLASTRHGIGAAVPLALLGLYAFFLKATPFAGNIVVSLLVAYTIVFGGLSTPGTGRLLLPALLAFLLNFSREVIKDVQDEAGDTAAGIKTTAALSPAFLRYVLIACSVTYAGFLFLPFILGHFGIVYCAVCGLFVLPLHGYSLSLLITKKWVDRLGRISFIMKIQMLAGLLALALDRAYFLVH
jgi:geranylgeranylglycerol-phosphate geranylgeranyltransferase